MSSVSQPGIPFINRRNSDEIIIPLNKVHELKVYRLIDTSDGEKRLNRGVRFDSRRQFIILELGKLNADELKGEVKLLLQTRNMEMRSELNLAALMRQTERVQLLELKTINLHLDKYLAIDPSKQDQEMLINNYRKSLNTYSVIYQKLSTLLLSIPHEANPARLPTVEQFSISVGDAKSEMALTARKAQGQIRSLQETFLKPQIHGLNASLA